LGLRWFEFDPGYLFIRMLVAVGLAWNVKMLGPDGSRGGCANRRWMWLISNLARR
jgi:hypothetical protein